MLDNLAIINRMIDEHQAIRGHIKLVGESISDREALMSLERARADWVPGQLEILGEKQRNLQQAMSYLDEGLRNHYAYEETMLPALLGNLFMKALILDHREIQEQLDKAKSLVADTKLEGLSREELLTRESHLKQVIDKICQLVEEHTLKEDTIFQMLKRALAAN